MRFCIAPNRVQTPNQIIRYSNRLEIRNPGYSLKNEEHLGEPGSEARNPKIAAVLHETRFAETKGSGIRVMRSKMQEAGLTPPLFESNRAANTFVATFLFHHFLGEDDVLWLAGYKEWNLSDEEAKALIYVREQGAINNAAYRNLNLTDTLNASTHLRRLRDCGLLEKKGKSSATYYIHGPKFLPLTSTTLSEEPKSLSTESDRLSTELELLSTEFGDLYTELKDMLSGLSIEVQRALLSELPQERQAMGHRSDHTIAREIILRLCMLRPWRADELAILLQRSQLYMRQSYLSPMVTQGLLERTYPGAVTHPQQAYRTVQQLDAAN